MTAGGAEQQPGETTAATRTDDDQTGRTGSLDEGSLGASTHCTDFDLHIRELLDLVSDQLIRRLGHHLVHLVDAVLPLLCVERVIRAVVPCGDGDQRDTAQGCRLEGTGNRQAPLRGVVQADDNRRTVAILRLVGHDCDGALRLRNNIVGRAAQHLHQSRRPGATGTHDDLVGVLAGFCEQVSGMTLDYRCLHRQIRVLGPDPCCDIADDAFRLVMDHFFIGASLALGDGSGLAGRNR